MFTLLGMFATISSTDCSTFTTPMSLRVSDWMIVMASVVSASVLGIMVPVTTTVWSCTGEIVGAGAGTVLACASRMGAFAEVVFAVVVFEAAVVLVALTRVVAGGAVVASCA